MSRYQTLQLTQAPVFTNKIVISNTGTFSTPEGVTALKVSVLGAGGNYTASCGGGGGGFAQKIISTRPGCSYCVVSPTAGSDGYSCFPTLCATAGSGQTPGCGYGGSINNAGGCGGCGGSVCCDKAGCFVRGGSGGSGAGLSGLGVDGRSACGTPGCTAGGCNGVAGSSGCLGACCCSCGGFYDAQNPSSEYIGLESGGSGASQAPCWNSTSATWKNGGHGSGGGGCGQCNSNCFCGGLGGRGFVTIQF